MFVCLGYGWVGYFTFLSFLSTFLRLVCYAHVFPCTCIIYMYTYITYLLIHVYTYIYVRLCTLHFVHIVSLDLLFNYIRDDSITTNCKSEGGGRTALFMGNKSPLTDTYMYIHVYTMYIVHVPVPGVL